jgi:hypothetical protein
MDEISEPLSKRQAIEKIVTQINGPMDLDEFTRQVLALWPTKAKKPKPGIRQALRYDYIGKTLLYLDEQTLIPMRLAMPGIRFRIRLTRQEIQKGWLFVYPAFQFMAAQDVPAEEFWLEEADGRSIPVNTVTVKSRVKTLFGTQETEQTAFELKWWYQKHILRRGDSLLVTVLDWEKGRFRLAPESARVREHHAVETQAQNQALADDLFQQLETARYEDVQGSIAIPTAFLHLKVADAYPPDHWLEVLERDGRMQWTGYEIRYADWDSPFDRMFNDLGGEPRQSPSTQQKPLSKQETRQVYRFKAAFWHNKSLWRRIEIQGGQTLAEFDDILRTAFQHDPSDHLSGFWKLVRRGQSRRFREVDLGDINPFEGGGAEDIQVASLSLRPGDALKYVYDFGDWIEHRLVFESIAEPENKTKYPRISGQNKPRYQDCVVCKKQGRKAVATWICITCFNQEQRDIYLCEACAAAHDEDHYMEEVLY